MPLQLPAEFLQQFIHQYVQPTAAEMHHFVSKVSLVQFEKNAIIEAFDSTVMKLHFLIEGYARHYFTDAAGNEVSIWISEPGGLSTDYAAFTKNNTTQYQIQAITAVTCLSITKEDLNELYDSAKIWERLGRLINQQYLNDFIDRNNFLISLSAKEKYDFLFKHKPHLFNIVPLKYLASYLGVSVETLSRMRSNTY
jgi:CRP-like cAMP-binding protein